MRPGYPKLISDVWGIEGPIDAAFTRINCQGKTYLFKVGKSLAVGLGVLLEGPIQLPNPPVHTHTQSGCQIYPYPGLQAATASWWGFPASTHTLVLHPAP